jgi:hypothetical protein
MSIPKRAKLMVAAISVLGAVGIAGTAFTSTGVTTTGQAASAQFVGGTVTQSVDGATLSSIAYGFADGTNTAVNAVTLTFANDLTDGMTPTVAFTGGDAEATFTCAAVEATGHTSTCSPDGANRSGITSIAVTVA